uniref:Uncharacterized protein n=1 Tax=Acrobeloides nanus TaxID=290746 RepID=A0A914CMG1_9BILA
MPQEFKYQGKVKHPMASSPLSPPLLVEEESSETEQQIFFEASLNEIYALGNTIEYESPKSLSSKSQRIPKSAKSSSGSSATSSENSE